MIAREKWNEVTKDQFKRVYAEMHCPLVLTDVCNVPAVDRWTSFDYFLSVGIPKDQYVDVSVSEETFSGEISNHMEMRMLFNECIEKMKRHCSKQVRSETKRRRKTLRYYLCQCPLSREKDETNRETLPNLFRDVTTPPFLDSMDNVSSINLWCAGDAVTSSLHYDENHNILIVTRGQKRVKLYSPSRTEIEPNGVHSNSGNHARLRPEKKTIEPDFVVNIFPGTALFIPEGWYHEVESSMGTYCCSSSNASNYHERK